MPGSFPDTEVLEAVFAALPDVVLVVDEDRTIQFMNRIETEHRTEDLIGTPAVSHVAEHLREHTRAQFDRVFETMEPLEQLTEVVGNDGESSWFQGYMIPIVRDGRAVKVVVITRNVTERMQAENELELLHQILPVCAWCKKVQDDDGEWHSLERYLEQSGEGRVSHGMCPTCERKMTEDEQTKATG